jgi:hypothetical protein
MGSMLARPPQLFRYGTGGGFLSLSAGALLHGAMRSSPRTQALWNFATRD